MLFLYTANHGDSIDGLAKRFCSSREKIIKMNNISDECIDGKRLLICSDMPTPLWMQDALLCFEDLDYKQLSALIYHCANKEGCSEQDDYSIEFDKTSLEEASINNNDAEDISPINRCNETADGENIKNRNRDEGCVEERMNNPNDRSRNDEFADNIKNDISCDANEDIGAKCATETMQGWLIHKVQENQSIADIARKYGVTTSILQKCGAPLNPEAGTEIAIPPIQGRRYFYTVKTGDDIEKVAIRFRCSPEKLINTNMLDKNDLLIPGTRLLILI